MAAATHQASSSAAHTQTRPHAQTSFTATATQTATQAVLHLRGATREEERTEGGERAGRRIQWAEDVVDNEGLGRKKSKVCCIYHAPKEFGESSDESSSDSDDSESDGGAGDGGARPARRAVSGNHSYGRDHGPGGHAHNGKANGKGKGKARASSPNAYEKVPRNTKKPAASGSGTTGS